MLPRCDRCQLPAPQCLCAAIPRVDTRVEVVILRHIKEGGRSSNTGKLAHLALPNSRLLTHGLPHQPLDPEAWRGAWLLYPGGGATPPEAVERLVVLDGSWRQVGRMLRRIPGLATLPRFSLPEARADGPRMRRPPHPEGRATLEAAAEALTLLEGPATGAPLWALFELAVARLRESRGRSAPP